MAAPPAANLTDRELREALRKLRVDTVSAKTRDQLVALYNRYATDGQGAVGARPPAAAVAAARRALHGGPGPAGQQAAAYPRYVDGKYVKPPSGLIFGLKPWQAGVVAVVAAGWLLGPGGPGGGGGGASDGEADPLGVRGNEWAYRPGDHSPGTVLDVRRHEQVLGAIGHAGDVTNLPVVVDFYSPSCGPCRAIAPLYSALATSFTGRAVFVKVDASSLQRTAMMFNVRAMPTFVFFHKNQPVHSFTGANAEQLRATLQALADRAKDEGTFASEAEYPSLEEVRAAVLRGTARPSGELSAEETAAFVAAVDAKSSQLHEMYAGKPARLRRRLAMELSGRGGDGTSGPGSAAAGGDAGVAAQQQQQQDSLGAAAANGDAQGGGGAGRDGSAPDPSTAVGEDGTLPYLDQDSPRVQAGSTPENVVIIGGGPAGLSAAIYAARAGLSPLVVAPEEGGQLLGKGVGVENFPGIFGGGSEDNITSGKEVVQVMRRQALGFGTAFLRGVVADVDFASTPKRLTVTASNMMLEHRNVTVTARAVVLAMGSRSRWLGLPGEELLQGHGVSACATCDGYLWRDRDVAVVGGGDSAMESALVLARTARSVVLVHRQDTFRASRILADKVKAHPAITIRWKTEVRQFVGGPDSGGLEAIEVWDASAERIENIPVSACFVAIGHIPNTALLQGHVPLDNHGYVRLSNPPRTAVVGAEGVFAAGDVADSVYRQAVTSAGTGAAAALDAERWLSETASSE